MQHMTRREYLASPWGGRCVMLLWLHLQLPFWLAKNQNVIRCQRPSVCHGHGAWAVIGVFSNGQIGIL